MFNLQSKSLEIHIFDAPVITTNRHCMHFGYLHGLRTPRESSFRKSQTFGLGQTNWADKFWGIWGIFGQTISTHFDTLKSFVHVYCFPLFNHYFYKKLSLHIHIPNIYLFEFGPQRIRYLVFVCP